MSVSWVEAKTTLSCWKRSIDGEVEPSWGVLPVLAAAVSEAIDFDHFVFPADAFALGS